MKVLGDIDRIVRWYAALPAGYNQINELMHNRQILSGYLVSYTTSLGELRREWNIAQANRENKKNEIHFKALQGPEKKPSNQAELLARLNTSLELSIEKEAEGMYYSHKENVESIKEVLSAMAQHIAISRDELSRRNMANPT